MIAYGRWGKLTKITPLLNRITIKFNNAVNLSAKIRKIENAAIINTNLCIIIPMLCPQKDETAGHIQHIPSPILSETKDQ